LRHLLIGRIVPQHLKRAFLWSLRAVRVLRLLLGRWILLLICELAGHGLPIIVCHRFQVLGIKAHLEPGSELVPVLIDHGVFEDSRGVGLEGVALGWVELAGRSE
jgi:hypothetical protein